LRTQFGVALLLIAAFALPSDSNAQQRDSQRLYRWVDKNGVVQYGDTIPPEYAATDRDVLNSRGVRVGFEEGEITPEEQAILDQKKSAEEQRRQAQLDVARRDRMLLAAYSTVSDIEDLRDRRIELLESQIKVTELYLTNLRKRLVDLQQEASSFKPYTTEPNAPQIPENLALDISRTTASINVFEQTLARTRTDQQALRISFDNDIARFKELKGG
jgi:hypothetical protein